MVPVVSVLSIELIFNVDPRLCISSDKSLVSRRKDEKIKRSILLPCLCIKYEAGARRRFSLAYRLEAGWKTSLVSA